MPKIELHENYNKLTTAPHALDHGERRKERSNKEEKRYPTPFLHSGTILMQLLCQPTTNDPKNIVF